MVESERGKEEAVIHYTPVSSGTEVALPGAAGKSESGAGLRAGRPAVRREPRPAAPAGPRYRLPPEALGRWAEGAAAGAQALEPHPTVAGRAVRVDAAAVARTGPGATPPVVHSPSPPASSGATLLRPPPVRTVDMAGAPGAVGEPLGGPRVAVGVRPALGATAAPPVGRTHYEDVLLNEWRHTGLSVEVRLMAGGAVVGRLLNFDTYGLILDTLEGPTIVFKHAVVSVRQATGGAIPRPAPAAGADHAARGRERASGESPTAAGRIAMADGNGTVSGDGAPRESGAAVKP